MLDRKMQDFDTSVENADATDERGQRFEQFRQYLLFIFKRVLVFVSFGPGVLGVLWLLGRIFKRSR